MEDAKNPDNRNVAKEATAHASPAAAGDAAAQAKLAARRKFIAGGLAAAPVLATLSNRSALAWGDKYKYDDKSKGGGKGYCHPSIYASFIQTTSLDFKKDSCDGRSPGYWWKQCKDHPECHNNYTSFEGQKTWHEVFGVDSPYFPGWFTLCMVLSLTGGSAYGQVLDTLVGTGGNDNLGEYQVATYPYGGGSSGGGSSSDGCSNNYYGYPYGYTTYGPCCEASNESASIIPKCGEPGTMDIVYGAGDLSQTGVCGHTYTDPYQFGAHAAAAYLNATVLGASNYMPKETVITLVTAALTDETAFGWDGWTMQEVVAFIQQTFSE